MSKEMLSDELTPPTSRLPQRRERARVVGLDHRRLEEERQEGAREEHDDEAPERDLAEHERPVVREDLPAEFVDIRTG